MRYVKHIAHVIYATIALHLSMFASDRWKDAYTDVGLDHLMQGVEHVVFTSYDGSK